MQRSTNSGPSGKPATPPSAGTSPTVSPTPVTSVPPSSSAEESGAEDEGDEQRIQNSTVEDAKPTDVLRYNGLGEDPTVASVYDTTAFPLCYEY